MITDDAFEVIRARLVDRRRAVEGSFEPIVLPAGTSLSPIPLWLTARLARDLDLTQLPSAYIVDIGTAAMLTDTELMTDCWRELDRRSRKRSVRTLERAMAVAGVHPIRWLNDARQAVSGLRRGPMGKHRVYAVLLGGYGDEADEHRVYVGETSQVPDLRFLQHLTNVIPTTLKIPGKSMRLAALPVRKRGIELLPLLVRHVDFVQREDALRIEGEIAEVLKTVGVRVRGGH